MNASPTDAVQVRGIGKRFPGVIANHDVDITIRTGTVHALIGENGAGKSTLMKILYGVQKPDDGTLVVDGEEVSFSSPTDAIAAGIGMVFQHFMLADNFTVLENVVLGAEKMHGIGDAARTKIQEISQAYGFGLDPDELVEDLGVGERQRVEILKVLYRGAKIIILDEPTAVLVPQEVDALFGNLRELKAEGHTILFISHKLDEVLAIADDITVMRRGTTVGEARPADTTKRQLAELMVGSELPSPQTAVSTVTDHVLLEVSDLTLTDSFGRDLLSDIDLIIHRGEVLGIAGVEGNGQAELVETVMGMRKPTAGTISVEGQDITRLGHPRAARGRHRLHPRGPAPPRPAARRPALGEPDPGLAEPSPRLATASSSTARRPDEDTQRIVEEYDVRTPGIDTNSRALSGGNQQKLIVGREMSNEPVLAAGRPPDPRRRRRRPGRDLGAHQAGSREGPGGAADLRRPRRADRPVRPDRGHPPRPVGRRVRPAGRHPAGPGRRHDRRPGRGGHRMTILRRVLGALIAPLVAVVAAMAITSLVIMASGSSPGDFWSVMLEPPADRAMVNIVNQSSMIFLSALAAAIGFRMNLFNIGVEGQYQVASYAAAITVGAALVPGLLNVVLGLLVAMVVGAAWAGIAGVLKVTRGVSEVISTIMLNAIAVTLVGYLLNTYGLRSATPGARPRSPRVASSPGSCRSSTGTERSGRCAWSPSSPASRSPSCSTAPASASTCEPRACRSRPRSLPASRSTGWSSSR